MSTKNDTVLARWLRAASPAERDSLAAFAGTDTNYLYQIAACRREPGLGLGVRLSLGSMELAREGLDAFTVEELATMRALGK